ncbi:MAG: orotidine 5'-phosphate decarboxylase / HUMPS family protein [Candidatus Bathyarchaeia archaeon]
MGPAPSKLREPAYAEKFESYTTPLLNLRYPQIQIALDMDTADLETILTIAARCYKGGARIIEAGTPTMKDHGSRHIIPALRRVAPDAVLVDDLKSIDAAHMEARIAFRSGADIASVLALGGSSAIKEALREAVLQNKAILVDTIRCENPLEELGKLTREFKGYENWLMFNLHRGITDQIRKGHGVYQERDLISSARKSAGDFRLNVAGGIKRGTIKEIMSLGVDVCTVGGAVTRSSDPETVTRKMLEEAYTSFRPLKSSAENPA